MVKRVYPEAGELWEHAVSRHQYLIHSRTDDGWTRYRVAAGRYDYYPLWTMPTDRFMDTYRKARPENG